MFGPLLFPSGSSSNAAEDPSSSSSVHFDPSEQKFGPCLLCTKVYRFPNDAQDCLSHIFHDHNLVIGDVHQIVDLPEYLRFWKKKLTPENLGEFCSKMKVDVNKKTGEVLKDQEYYLLCDVINDDKEIRKKLQDDKIQSALDQQKKEREDSNYTRGCLFCRQDISPTREEYLNHLSTQHNVQLGRPANLVYVDKLITIIEEKMENLQCIYCEKYFRDRNVLKEHMRKKGHKRVNPNNELYDQFYIVNYLDAGKKWKENARLKRDASPLDDREDEDGSDWSDWEDECKMSIVCLFCERTEDSWDGILSHMTREHSFDYQENAKGMDFYHQVKTINYIRRQIFKNRCVICDEEAGDREKLLDHMTKAGHFTMPGSELWDKPEYFFPTYENDAFLSQIDDNSKDDDEDVDNSENP